MPLTSLLVADDQEKLPTGQCRPRVPPSPINLRGDAYLSLQKVLAQAQVRRKNVERTVIARVRPGRSFSGSVLFFVDARHDVHTTRT